MDFNENEGGRHMYTGNGYLGSQELQTSKVNEEVIPSPPVNWTSGYMCGRFEWANDQDATVIINGKTKVFIRLGFGFKADLKSEPIHSFIIETPDVTFTWIAEY